MRTERAPHVNPDQGKLDLTNVVPVIEKTEYEFAESDDPGEAYKRANQIQLEKLRTRTNKHNNN